MAKTTIPMQRTKKGFSVKMRDIKFPKKDAPKKDEAKATPPPPPAPAVGMASNARRYAQEPRATRPQPP